MFGKCKVCAEKDKTIEYLQHLLDRQQTLVSAIVIPNQYQPALTVEANQMLDGASTNTFNFKSMTLSPDPKAPEQPTAVEQQAIEMLSGVYS